jgi:signal transduction histidine kinase
VAPLQMQAQAKGLRFEVNVEPDLPQVETDPQRLRQLLLSLLSNAVKFTSKGGVAVTVVMRDGSVDSSADADAYSLFPDRRIEITVADTGPGVPREHRERIFGPFEQLSDPARSDSMTRGTGLGLTVARQLAHLLGGRLYLAESSPSGSRFCVHLPLSLGAPAALDQEQSAR